MASENDDDIESTNSYMEAPLDEYDGQSTFKRQPKQAPEEPRRNEPKNRKKGDTDDQELVKTKAPWGEYRKPKRKRQKKAKKPKPGKPRDGLSDDDKTPTSTGRFGGTTNEAGVEGQDGDGNTSSPPRHTEDQAGFGRKGTKGSRAPGAKRGFFSSLFPQNKTRNPEQGTGDSGGTNTTERGQDYTGGEEQSRGFGGGQGATSDQTRGGEYVRESPGGDADKPGDARKVKSRQAAAGQLGRKGSVHSETSGTLNPISKLQNTLRRKKSGNALETTSYRTDVDPEEQKKRPLVNRLTRRKSSDIDQETTGEFKDRSIKQRGGNLKAKTNRKKSVTDKQKNKSSYREDAKERKTRNGKKSVSDSARDSRNDNRSAFSSTSDQYRNDDNRSGTGLFSRNRRQSRDSDSGTHYRSDYDDEDENDRKSSRFGRNRRKRQASGGMYINDDYDDAESQVNSQVVRRGGQRNGRNGYYGNSDEEDEEDGKKKSWFRRKKGKKKNGYTGNRRDDDDDGNGEGMHGRVDRKGRRKTLDSGYFTEDSDDSRGGNLRRRVDRTKMNTNDDYDDFRDDFDDDDEERHGRVRRRGNGDGEDGDYREDGEDEDGERRYRVDSKGNKVFDSNYREDEAEDSELMSKRRKKPEFDLCCKCMGTTILELVVLTLVYFTTVVLLDMDWGWPQCFFVGEGWDTLYSDDIVQDLESTTTYSSSADVQGMNCDVRELKHRSDNWESQAVCVNYTTYCNQRFVPASVDYLLISLFVWPLWFVNLILQTIHARRIYRDHTKPGTERQKHIRDDRKQDAVDNANKRNVDWDMNLSKWQVARNKNSNRRRFTWKLSTELRMFHSAELRRRRANACADYLRRWGRAMYMYIQHASFFVISTFLVIQLLPERIGDYTDFSNLPYLLLVLFGPMFLEFLFMGIAAVYVKWPRKEIPDYPQGKRKSQLDDPTYNGNNGSAAMNYYGPSGGGGREEDGDEDARRETGGDNNSQDERIGEVEEGEELDDGMHVIEVESESGSGTGPRGQGDVTLFPVVVGNDDGQQGEPEVRVATESFDMFREVSLEGDSEDSDGDSNGVIITVGDIKLGRLRKSQKDLRKSQMEEPLEFILDLDESSQGQTSSNGNIEEDFQRMSTDDSSEGREVESLESGSEIYPSGPGENRIKRTATMATAEKSPEIEPVLRPKIDDSEQEVANASAIGPPPERSFNVARDESELSSDPSTASRQQWNDRLYTVERAVYGKEKERELLEEVVDLSNKWHKEINGRLCEVEITIYDKSKDIQMEERFEQLERSIFGSNPTKRAAINRLKSTMRWDYGRGGADDHLVDNVCLVITCHETCYTETETKAFEETLRHALNLFPPEAIFVCDNSNSPYPVDNTEAVCKAVCREFYEDYDINYLYIPEGNKTHAQYWASDIWIPLLVRSGFVPNFEFCMIVDDDVPLPEDLAIQEAVDTMVKRPYVHAMGFAITAEAMDGKPNRLIDCQDFEYRFTGLAKLVMDRYGTVNFCHGAVGLWRRSVLGEKVLYHHNTEFYGDDMYMGNLLHEMGNNYKISFRANTLVPTFAPPDLLTLYCQRVQSWDKAIHRKFTYLIRWLLFRWCGGWRKLVLKFFHLYDILLEVRDYQLIFFIFGTVHRDPSAFLWIIFQLAYLPVLLGVFACIVLQYRPELRPKPITLVLYMFYKGFLLFLRIMALLEDIVRYAPWGRQHRRIGERVEKDRDLPPAPRPSSVDWNTIWQRKKTLRGRPSLRSLF